MIQICVHCRAQAGYPHEQSCPGPQYNEEPKSRAFGDAIYEAWRSGDDPDAVDRDDVDGNS